MAIPHPTYAAAAPLAWRLLSRLLLQGSLLRCSKSADAKPLFT